MASGFFLIERAHSFDVFNKSQQNQKSQTEKIGDHVEIIKQVEAWAAAAGST
jgi:hypothetical protein